MIEVAGVISHNSAYWILLYTCSVLGGHSIIGRHKLYIYIYAVLYMVHLSLKGRWHRKF